MAKIITRAIEIFKKPSIKVSVYDHFINKMDKNKKYKEVNLDFQELMKDKQITDLLNEILAVATESSNGEEIDSTRFLTKLSSTTKGNRILINNKTYILQYIKSISKIGLELDLILKSQNQNYNLRVLNLGNKPDTHKYCSVIRYQLANIFEELGIETIRPVFVSFNPQTKIDLSVYKTTAPYKIQLVSEEQRIEILQKLEKSYQKLFSKHPELNGTSLSKISDDLFHIGSKSVYKIIDGPKKGQIIIDTRLI